MGPKAKSSGRGRGRPPKAKQMKIETEAQRLAREERELVEAKKHQLMEYVSQYPVIFDISHPDHLNSALTKVLWEDIAEKLDEAGITLSIICRYLFINYQHFVTDNSRSTIIFGNILGTCIILSRNDQSMVAKFEGSISELLERSNGPEKWLGRR